VYTLTDPSLALADFRSWLFNGLSGSNIPDFELDAIFFAGCGAKLSIYRTSLLEGAVESC